ncbi:MAG: hypothetical protein QNJ94_04295 [Alphaproteobacteria bacterium]|nr:hypothetical protein [Alphaproteobacteria bacterium]
MIKKLFGRSDRVLSAHRRAGGELGVFTLALVGVADCFDADQLWDRKYGGGAKITEKVSGAEEFRLEAALDGCRNSVFARDEAGRFREQNPVFTDVVAWIPAATWHAESVRGGHRIQALATNLEILHSTKFKGSLPGDRSPVYTIMPDEDIAENEVVFQFGFGVFVPTGDDVLQATLSLRRGDTTEARDFPEWSFWQDGAQVKRPVGVYRNQRSVLIAANAQGPIRAPIWFPHGEGHILINLNAADSQRIYADNEVVDVVEARKPKTRGEPYEWFLADRRQGKGAKAKPFDRVVVRLTPLAEAVRISERRAAGQSFRIDAGKLRDRPADIDENKTTRARTPRGAPAQAESGGRRFGLDRLLGGRAKGRSGAETPLSDRFSVRLAGLALMRIDGAHQLKGLLDWTIYFDDDGRPVPFADASSVDSKGCLALQATNRDEQLYYRLATEQGFKPVATIPCVLPTRNKQYLDLLPAPVPDRYIGLLMLSEQPAFPLSPKSLILGRSNLDATAQQPDLPLELLTHPESLSWAQGAGYPGAKLNAINLSRRHVSLRLEEDTLSLGIAEGSSPVFALDERGSLIDKLEPGMRREIALRDAQAFIVGSYLLRFHEEKTRTMVSSEETILRRRPEA